MIKKLLFASAIVLGTAFTAKSQIVINEISYNPPESGTDSLEYIEIYNAGSSTVDITGYTFTSGIVYTFPTFFLNNGAYVVVAVDSAAVENVFSVTGVFQWTSGGLSNGGEPIALKDALGNLVDSVNYDDVAPWDATGACDGGGHSLILCSPTADNNDGNNWSIATDSTGVIINTKEVVGSPGSVNVCLAVPPPAPYVLRSIDDVNDADATTGLADSLGLRVELRGIVHCGDLRAGAGYDFPLANSNNEGIRVVSFVDVSSYNVGTGDSVHISGEITQFNGLIQISPDSISLISAANPQVSAMMVTVLDEATENKYVQLSGVHLVDPLEWTGAGSGFNVRVTDGSSDTNIVRIDDDNASYGMPAPTGTFNVSGWGGQYDASSPYLDGYQMVPCTPNDIVPVTTSISELSNNDLVIYPNPTSEQLNLKGINNIETVEVYNSLGKRVFANKGSLNSINVASYRAGNYVLVVKGADAIYNKHFVVVK